METKSPAEEIRTFAELWSGGYYEGDPREPLARSEYRNLGYISILYATYLRCIRPFVTSVTNVVEIGPGRGAWTKCMLDAKEIWALDAQSSEHTGFFEYLGHPANARYFQVSDFECTELPEDHFDHMFSFGCLCHVSPEGIDAYAKNIFPKLRSGANCFWMIADKRRYEAFVKDRDRFDIWKQNAPKRKGSGIVRKVFGLLSRRTEPAFVHFDPFVPGPGQWYDAGLDRTCSVLEKIGYRIVESDVGTVPRDPIIHFMKP